MKYLRFGTIGIVVLLGVGLWVRSSLVEERDAFLAFCNATRRGEPFPLVLQRAQAKQWTFVRANPSTAKEPEYLATVDVMGYRLGCRVTLGKDGRVLEAKASELPWN